jgi:hypothetical protein
MFQNYKLSRPVFFSVDRRILIWFFFIFTPLRITFFRALKTTGFPYTFIYIYIHTYIRVHAFLYTCTQTINEPLLYTVCLFPVPEIMDKQKVQPLLILSPRCVPTYSVDIYIYILYIYSLCSHIDVQSLTCEARGKMYLKIECMWCIYRYTILYDIPTRPPLLSICVLCLQLPPK